MNIALPVYYLRYQRPLFSVWRHMVFPIIGTAFLALPLWGLIQPGQPSPYNVFPYVVLGFLVLSVIYANFLSARHPDLKDRVGSIIADE
ncbi:MAG: hypothetical protein ACYCYO_12935 [Bacilli bacterium]